MFCNLLELSERRTVEITDLCNDTEVLCGICKLYTESSASLELFGTFNLTFTL